MDEIFYQIFSELPRQGPGCAESTKRAYECLTNLPIAPKILDVGCGSGAQTIELAKLSGGHITALDNYAPFLDTLNKNAQSAKMSDKIETVVGSMDAMSFDSESFDIIWEEGSIFIIGFEKGLRDWKKFLKPSGYLCVSELTWLKQNPPKEISDFLVGEYPALTDVAGNLEMAKKTGYNEIGHFAIPKTAWTEKYYKPLQEQILLFRARSEDKPKSIELLDHLQLEIDMYKKYSDWYGYVFYIFQKP